MDKNHQGSTYNITKLFLNKLADENTEIIEFFMPRDTPSSCVGCCNCFTKGELQCPHAEMVQPVVRAIEEADLVILDSPCYVLGMTGQLKTFLDHMGYRWLAHRPHPQMFGRDRTRGFDRGGRRGKKSHERSAATLFLLGNPPKFCLCKKHQSNQLGDAVPAKRKARIEKDVTRLAKKILQRQRKSKAGNKDQIHL